MPVGLRVAGSGFATASDNAWLDVAGDIDIRVQCSLDDWTPGALSTLLSKYNNTIAGSSYLFRVSAAGALHLVWSNGVAILSAASTVATGIPDGATRWVRVTMDVDDGAGNRVVNFYTSTDGAVWTQLGATVTTAGVTSINNSATALFVGARADSVEFPTGWFYRAEVRDGIDGVVVANPDFRIQRMGPLVGMSDTAGNVYFASPIAHDGTYRAGSEEALQAQSQRQYDLDLNGGLRVASGIAKDANGVSHQLWGTDLYAARDQAYVLLGGT